MKKSDKFREFMEEENCLQNQLDDCRKAQSRMLKKAFKGFGLKLGYIPEMYDNQSVIKIAGITEGSVIYYRNTGVKIEVHDISFEYLFDAEGE